MGKPGQGGAVLCCDVLRLAAGQQADMAGTCHMAHGSRGMDRAVQSCRELNAIGEMSSLLHLMKSLISTYCFSALRSHWHS